MAKKIQLTIAEPCHENWDAMTPVEKGKFCGSCQKQVVDFSNMSDRQVAEFFKKPILSLSKGGSVCGRFMTDQLDREIEIPRKRIPWLKYFFQIAIPAFLVSIKTSGQRTQGKPTMRTVQTDTIKKPEYQDIRKMGMVARPEKIVVDTTPVKEPVQMLKGEVYVKPDTIPVCNSQIMGGISVAPVINKKEMYGRVVDQDGQAVAFASIETGKEHKGIIADENGVFRINRSWLNKADKIMVSSNGYESDTVAVGKNDYMTGELYVQLKANVVLPEVVVTALGITGRITRITMGATVVKGETIIVADKKDSVATDRIIAPIMSNNLFVYPNPATAGSSVNISLKDFEEGYHQLQFINQSGQMIRQQEVWIDAEARLMNTEIPIVSAGTYFMILTNKKTGKKYAEKIIIQ